MELIAGRLKLAHVTIHIEVLREWAGQMHDFLGSGDPQTVRPLVRLVVQAAELKVNHLTLHYTTERLMETLLLKAKAQPVVMDSAPGGT